VQRLDEDRVLWAVSECGTHFDDVFLERLRLDHTATPHGAKKLIVRYEAAGVSDEVREDREGLRRKQNTVLVFRVPPPPEALVDRVEPKSSKRLHRWPLRAKPAWKPIPY
jgi:hypothetical protein